MKIDTTRFGTIEIDEKKILFFVKEILGFYGIKKFIVIDHPGKPDIPFKWLQSVEIPEVAFLITDPHIFYPEYKPDIDAHDRRELDITEDKDLAIVSIVTVPHEDPHKVTINLKGPILINLKNRKAKQKILNKDYPIQYPLYKLAQV